MYQNVNKNLIFIASISQKILNSYIFHPFEILNQGRVLFLLQFFVSAFWKQRSMVKISYYFSLYLNKGRISGFQIVFSQFNIKFCVKMVHNLEIFYGKTGRKKSFTCQFFTMLDCLLKTALMPCYSIWDLTNSNYFCFIAKLCSFLALFAEKITLHFLVTTMAVRKLSPLLRKR